MQNAGTFHATDSPALALHPAYMLHLTGIGMLLVVVAMPAVTMEHARLSQYLLPQAEPMICQVCQFATAQPLLPQPLHGLHAGLHGCIC